MEISAYFAYSPPIVLSALSKTSSTEACPTGLRTLEPLKMTSVSDSPRNCLGELSPITQETASITFDLPQPLGPTMAIKLLGREMVVGSTKDLNPDNLILVSCIVKALYIPYLQQFPLTGCFGSYAAQVKRKACGRRAIVQNN